MAKIEGRNLLVFVAKANGTYVPIASGISCELDENTSLQETASDSQYKKYVKKRKGWKVSTHHLLTTDNCDLFAELNGQDVGIKFTTVTDSRVPTAASNREETNAFKRTGNAICTRCTITAKNGNHVTGSFEFTGNGGLT